jgi:hypothetical protein
VTVRGEFSDDLGADQPGPADDDDLHDDLLLLVVARLALQEGEPVGVDLISVPAVMVPMDLLLAGRT